MENLFKFVTIRDAKKTTPVYEENPILVLENFTAELAYSSSLFKKLNAIKSDEKLKPEQLIEKTIGTITDFAKSQDFIKHPNNLGGIFTKWVQKYETLNSLNKKQNFDPKKIELILSELLDGKKKQYLSSEEKIKIVDNLLAQLIVFKNPELINRFSSIIKLLNFAIKYEGQKENRGILKTLKYPLIVPAIVKLPIIKKSKKPTADRNKEAAEIKQKFLTYQNYLNAYENVKNLFILQKQTYTALPTEKVATYELGKINPGDFQKLPSSTKSLLTELSVKEGTSISETLGILESNGRAATESLAGHIQTNNINFLIGGVPISKTDFQNRIAANVEWNDTETGGVIIGNNGVCELRFPFKIANLRLVEQELIDYSAGKIAHVETTLQGEFKDRSTRRLSRSEESFSSSYEKEVVDERDTQTTDRFQLEKESSKVLKEDKEVYVKGELSASYGPVSLSVGAGYSNNTSVEESDNEAVTFAKDVVQRSLQRIIEKTKNERFTKTIAEFEEKNRHALDNRGGTGHSVGIFRWLDENYKVRIRTYDTRMILELMLPQPAKYHIGAFAENKDLEIVVPEPIHPHNLALPSILPCDGWTYTIKSHRDINFLNYHLLAAQYGAVIEAHPQMIYNFTHSIADGGTKNKDSVNISENKDIVIPDGYRADQIKYIFACDSLNSPWADHIFFGGRWIVVTGAMGGTAPFDFEGSMNTISVRWNSGHIGASFYITCVLTEKAYEDWQIKTYRAIIDAYNKKKGAYDNALAEAKANAGIRIRGTNPAINKELIRTELKKNAIYLMSHCNPINPQKVNEDGSFDCCRAMDEGQVIKFLDGVFEWKNMSYDLYDYFFANRSEWKFLYNISDPDPLMNNFLRAGAARVLIPVQKGKEMAVANFITIGTPLVEDLIDMEITDIADEFMGEEEIEDPLIVNDYPTTDSPDLRPLVVPTTLTIPECSSGGINPEKYKIRGEMCYSSMKPIIPIGEDDQPDDDEDNNDDHTHN